MGQNVLTRYLVCPLAQQLTSAVLTEVAMPRYGRKGSIAAAQLEALWVPSSPHTTIPCAHCPARVTPRT